MVHSFSQLKTKWKNSYSTCVICVACTNKQTRNLSELRWSPCGPDWRALWMLIVVSVETVCLEQMGRKNGARRSNVLGEAVIVTIHLNKVSITSNQPFWILNQPNTLERLKASFTDRQSFSQQLWVMLCLFTSGCEEEPENIL